MDGEGAATDWMCQKLFVKFHAGDFSPGDPPQSGRQVEVDSDEIETLIESSQCYTTWEVANILKISKSRFIGENEKCVLYFMEKTMWTFWLTHH